MSESYGTYASLSRLPLFHLLICYVPTYSSNNLHILYAMYFYNYNLIYFFVNDCIHIIIAHETHIILQRFRANIN